jgi:ribosomal protein S27E
MDVQQKDTLFRGPVTIFTCPDCGDTLKRFDGGNILSSIFIHEHGGSEMMIRRADPISFSAGDSD